MHQLVADMVHQIVKHHSCIHMDRPTFDTIDPSCHVWEIHLSNEQSFPFRMQRDWIQEYQDLRLRNSMNR